ncbi:hypothetical protein ANAEL_03852 [Anaerolineales bacterium]|nr:hypothetical protein ANAEL_03852 [Anaerolineales bacterium]
MNLKSVFEKLNSPKLAGILLFAGTMVSIGWAVYFSIITISIPYQLELREGTALVTTRILLSGENPFSFENQPLAMTNYGIGYNLVVFPFARFLGNTLVVHRAVNFAFILLSALVCAVIVYKKQNDVSLSFACSAFVVIGLMANGGIGAYPSSLGTFLFLVAILIPYVRSFDRVGLSTSILFSLLAFYTKPYFVLAFGIVAVYLFLFVSKRKAVVYGFLFFAPLLLSLFVMRAVFPLYFIDTIIGNIFNTYKSSGHLIQQLKQLLLYFYPIMFLTLFMAAKVISRLRIVSAEGKWFDVSSWDQPFITCSMNYLFYSFVCSLLAFLLILGPHMGTYMNYAYQLLVPLFFCWFFQGVDLNHKFRLAAVLLILFNLFLWQSQVLDPVMLEQKNSKEWAKLDGYVKNSKNVLNSPLVTSQLVEMGLIPIDAGQSLVYYNVKPYPDFYLIGPPYSEWELDGYRYTKLIDRSIEKQNFDLVITTEEKATFFHVKRLPEYYSVVDELVINLPQTEQTWTVLLWKPLVK